MRLFLSGLLLLAVAHSPVMATVNQPLSDLELAERAHAIVLGRAAAQQTVWLGRDLVTLVTLTVGESLKGSPGATLTVALPGGIDRQRKIPIEILYVGAPRIANGEEVLLFLERSQRIVPGGFVVSGVSQGKFSIVEDAAGVKWVSKGARPFATDARASSRARDLKRLSDFRREILRHVGGGASSLTP